MVTFSIPANKFIYLSDLPEGTHKFTLNSQRTDDGKLYPQKLFKKIRLNGPLADANTEDVGSETVGVLGNGVEIKSYKSPDIFYYGPINDVEILKSIYLTKDARKNGVLVDFWTNLFILEL